MKFHSTALTILLCLSLKAQEETATQTMEDHAQGVSLLADDQDQLSADVQELIDEQTNQAVIKLLNNVETLMAEAIDDFEEGKTGGPTIAIETEVLEKIFEAAQKRAEASQDSEKDQDKKDGQGDQGDQKPGQGQDQGQQSNQAMLDMLQRMMGQTPESDSKGQKPGAGGQGGEQSGQAGAKDGASDADSAPSSGEANGKAAPRRVPKASGLAGAALPPEFQRSLDAYRAAR